MCAHNVKEQALPPTVNPATGVRPQKKPHPINLTNNQQTKLG